MSTHDDFLEALTEQAKGNHRKNSVTGRSLNEAAYTRPTSAWAANLPSERQETLRLGQELRSRLKRFSNTPTEKQLSNLLEKYVYEMWQLGKNPPPRPTRAEMNPPESLAQQHGQDWLNAPFGS